MRYPRILRRRSSGWLFVGEPLGSRAASLVNGLGPNSFVAVSNAETRPLSPECRCLSLLPDVSGVAKVLDLHCHAGRKQAHGNHDDHQSGKALGKCDPRPGSLGKEPSRCRRAVAQESRIAIPAVYGPIRPATLSINGNGYPAALAGSDKAKKRFRS